MALDVMTKFNSSIMKYMKEWDVVGIEVSYKAD